MLCNPSIAAVRSLPSYRLSDSIFPAYSFAPGISSRAFCAISALMSANGIQIVIAHDVPARATMPMETGTVQEKKVRNMQNARMMKEFFQTTGSGMLRIVTAAGASGYELFGDDLRMRRGRMRLVMKATRAKRKTAREPNSLATSMRR